MPLELHGWSFRQAQCRKQGYAQGGGLTPERLAVGEGIRLEAGERFGQGEKASVIARVLLVSERSVERWRRAWREGGTAGLESASPAKLL
ncbi:helix-turn-helix domain-containing protein [Streptomyces sp. NPDC093510]|uniref:helix-turn-helix domain-containing protein n=1 Tax=Streptomyces sp. NPDC093510 TaxID=3155199 RepID=UPI00343CDB4B